MDIHEVYSAFKSEREEATTWLEHEIVSLRTGRVTPRLVERILVEHYGTRTPLHGLASISNLDARTLVVQPWDAAAVTSIEKALVDANIGVNPTVDREVIRLVFPGMTDEMRQQQLKKLHAIAEETRVRFRQARDEALKELKTGKERGDLTEDDFYEGREELDDLINQANQAVEKIVTRKKEDIAAV